MENQENKPLFYKCHFENSYVFQSTNKKSNSMKPIQLKTGDTCFVAGEMRLCRYVTRNIVRIVETGQIKAVSPSDIHPIAFNNAWMIPFFNNGSSKQKISAFYFHYAKRFFSQRTEKKIMVLVIVLFAIVAIRAIYGVLFA